MEWTGMELGNNDFSSEGPSLGRLFASRYPPETDFVSMLHRWIFVRRKKMNIMKIGGGGAIFCLEFIYLCGLHCVKHDCCSYISLKQG